MCIAILNPPEFIIKEDILHNCWSNNNDGAGILWTERNRLKSFKETKSFETFFQKYTEVRNKNPKSNIVLHFRISTSGVIDEANTHPFFVNPDLAFVHNGIIKEMELSKKFCDTFMLNKLILSELPKDFLTNKAITTMLESFIGASKLLFLNSKNEFFILNEEMGHWEDNCWWSNYTYSYTYGKYSCASQYQQDYYDAGKYKTLSTGDIDKTKAYRDNEFCSECGKTLRSEYEQQYEICVECMEDLRGTLDQRYSFVSCSADEIKEGGGAPINEEIN